MATIYAPGPQNPWSGIVSTILGTIGAGVGGALAGPLGSTLGGALGSSALGSGGGAGGQVSPSTQHYNQTAGVPNFFGNSTDNLLYRRRI